MSSPLAIGAVSAVLRNLLDNGMIDAGAAVGSTVNVTAVAPDTINLESAEDPPRLNLFLHQVTANTGWRNVGLPSRSAAGNEQLTNPPLALDLHYLLTAYGRANFEAEILLGYAMYLLHERPVLDRAAIRNALNADPCILTPDALYRGAENQLYRVEIHQGSVDKDGTPLSPTFKWSRDNGSIATRWLGMDGNDVLVTTARGFNAGAWIELSDDSNDLDGVLGTLVKTVGQPGSLVGHDGRSVFRHAGRPPTSSYAMRNLRRTSRSRFEEHVN